MTANDFDGDVWEDEYGTHEQATSAMHKAFLEDIAPLMLAEPRARFEVEMDANNIIVRRSDAPELSWTLLRINEFE